LACVICCSTLRMRVPGTAVYVWAWAKRCVSFGCGDAPEPHHVQGAHEAPILTVVDQFVGVSGHVPHPETKILAPPASGPEEFWLRTDALNKLRNRGRGFTWKCRVLCKVETIQRP